VAVAVIALVIGSISPTLSASIERDESSVMNTMVSLQASESASRGSPAQPLA